MKKLLILLFILGVPVSYGKRKEIQKIYPITNFSTQSVKLGANECIARINPSEATPYKWLVARSSDYIYDTEEEVTKYVVKTGSTVEESSYLSRSGSRDKGQGSISQFLQVVARMVENNKVSETTQGRILDLSLAEKEVVLNLVVKDKEVGSFRQTTTSVKSIIHATNVSTTNASALGLENIQSKSRGINNLLNTLTFGLSSTIFDSMNATIISPWNKASKNFERKKKGKRLLKVSDVTEARINKVMELMTVYESIRLLEYACDEEEEDIKRQQMALVKYLGQATGTLNEFMSKRK